MTSELSSQVTVRRVTEVPLDPADAFELFTTRMGEFWPASHSIGSSPIADVVIEPWEGGRWFERGEDGQECVWGHVSGWRPPDAVRLVWQVGADWTYDAGLSTTVDVEFTECEIGTRVELMHRDLERYGERAPQMRSVFESENGWSGILDAFARLSTARDAG